MKLEILGAHNCESESSRLTCLLIARAIAIDEIARAAAELGSDITPGFEGMKIVL
ncbi:MAG: hypothetical protein U9N44_04425 [Chloroflexota bacterium]|nr:hypothetical protein [Chloroflexota bacterium]